MNRIVLLSVSLLIVISLASVGYYYYHAKTNPQYIKVSIDPQLGLQVNSKVINDYTKLYLQNTGWDANHPKTRVKITLADPKNTKTFIKEDSEYLVGFNFQDNDNLLEIDGYIKPEYKNDVSSAPSAVYF